MAQAIVQRPNMEPQQCLASGTPIVAAQANVAVDTSFLASAKKRKVGENGATNDRDRRVRVAAIPPLDSNPTLPPVAEVFDEDAGPADDKTGLFSPHFHLTDENAEPVAPHPLAPCAQANSTDASTGTSTSLSRDVADDECRILVPLPPPSAAENISTADEDVEDEAEWEFNPYLFIKRLPPLHHCISPRTSYLLPRQTRHSRRKTLVLDLDETLVHSTLEDPCGRPDFTFPVYIGNHTHHVSCRMRPHLHTFLERVSQLYEVVVFTASQQVYAAQLLDIIDPTGKHIRHRIYRDSCVMWEGNYLKDLTVLGRDLAHTIIIDNSPQAFGFQLENGIPIESWYDCDDDTELLKLLPFLEKAAKADDVRPLVKGFFRLHELVEAAQD